MILGSLFLISWRSKQNEVELLSKIQHSNIISLLGSASEINSSFVVYELMEKGSLDDQLHGKKNMF